MEAFTVATAIGLPDLGDCYCPICDKHILGIEDCIRVVRVKTQSYTYVCSDECANFFVLQDEA